MATKRMNAMVRSCAAGVAMLVGGLLAGQGTAAAGEAGHDARVARGKYLVTVSGCNDCHTAGYLENGGAVPESRWLEGAAVGYQGPWGTTYASNLRLVVARQTEAQWVQHARKERLPPMPWFNVAKMTDEDLKAVYAFIRSLGASGEAAPAYVAPGGKVATPYYVFVPVVDQKQAAAR
jgi:mono/diheme cytochrome c family protein